jgi:ferritin-like metal-binding protein YciE
VTNAKARGADEVARLPQQNLDQEQTTLEKVKTTGERISTEGIAVAV